MAVATYTTDLNPIDLAENLTTWADLADWGGGGTIYEDEQDYLIQGSYCTSQIATKTGASDITSLITDYGSDLAGSFTAGITCVFMWHVFLPANAVDTFANGGTRLVVAADQDNFNAWKVGGNDFGRNPYGGWQNVAVDPSYTPDYQDDGAVGNGGVYQWFGSAVYLLRGIGKGAPHGCDAIRYGRGELIVQYGQAAAYGTFVAMAAANDVQTARWGLFQAEGTGYLWKGLISLGTSTNEVDFRDSNRNITIDDTPRTYADFNKIEINYPSTNVEWTGINITSLNPLGLSIGQLEVTDSTAQVSFTNCVFTDMDIFLFELGCTLNLSTWRRCGQVTQGGGIFDGCIFDSCTDEVSLLVDDLDNIDNCDFTSDGSNHAIELTEEHAGGSYTLTGCTYNGYASSDGSTGNEVIFNDSSGSVIINVVGGDAPTIRNGLGASTSLPTSVALTMTVKDEDGAVIVGAYAYIDDDNITPFIMNTTTNASGIATVQHTGGAAPGSTWRVRKYGYKAYKQTVDIAGDDISIPVTLIEDPQQT